MKLNAMEEREVCPCGMERDDGVWWLECGLRCGRGHRDIPF